MAITDKEKIKVMQAYLDGKEIECRNKGLITWIYIKEPFWNWDAYEYRVRQLPEYKLDRDKHNKLFKLFTEKYDFDIIKFNQLLIDLGDIFGVIIKTE